MLETVRESRCRNRGLDPRDDRIGHGFIRVATGEPNSSPPRRATTSPTRTQELSASAIATEQLVADLVAVRVVDCLQAAAVDHHDGRGRLGARRRCRDRFVPREPVREPGQSVAAGVRLRTVEIRTHAVAHRRSREQRLGGLDHLRAERLAEHREPARGSRGRVQQQDEAGRRPLHLEQVVGDDPVRCGERGRQVVDAVALDALGKLAALASSRDSGFQLGSIDGLATAQVAGRDLRVLTQIGDTQFARQRTRRVIGETLQCLGESLGRSLEKCLEGGQDFELICETLRGPTSTTPSETKRPSSTRSASGTAMFSVLPKTTTTSWLTPTIAAKRA